MANVPDIGGDAGSNIVQGAGTSSRTYTLPSNVGQTVESVVATINNAAGGEQTVTMTIQDSSGEVIATRVQPDTIPAGDTGTATFALRLADDLGGAIRFRKVNTGQWLEVKTTGEGGDFGSGWGITLIAQSKGIVLDATGLSFFSDNGGDTIFDLSGDLTETVDGTANFTYNSGAFISYGADTTIQIVSGTSLTVVDESFNPIFRVDEDGDLHGKTGKALTFDL